MGKIVRFAFFPDCSNMSSMKKSDAVVLLSGGIDSSTTLAFAKSGELTITALSFDYGQRHKCELDAAIKVAKSFGVTDHMIVEINLRQFGESALTDSIDVPKGRSSKQIGEGIPVTYVPARNTIFLSYALALAEVRSASKIFIGANAVDYSGYPDCRPEFIEAFERLANIATKAGVEGNRIAIEAPLIELSKAEIIKRGTELGLNYGMTFSCYDPVDESLSCGECDSCIIRKKGFLEAQIVDPTRYAGKVNA
jgi:7-cyano-7-deazaguanine synthase